VEGLADADGDECLAAEALHGEGHAARRDVPDRPEGLEDPHLLSLSLSLSLSPAAFLGLGFAGDEAGAPAARVLEWVWEVEGKAAAGGGERGLSSRSVWSGG